MQRRNLLLAAAAVTMMSPVSRVQALTATSLDSLRDGDTAPRVTRRRLDNERSRLFREWMVCIVHAQIERGPTPRWKQRDCAGLVRFAAAEALREHDALWVRSMGLDGLALPPALPVDAMTGSLRNAWMRVDGSRANWVGALELVQENTRPVGRDAWLAQSGDLFFFDQGDSQHLMIWMGEYLAYHTGQPADTAGKDNGLRAYTLKQLMDWRDTRWKPEAGNPNFAGVFRLDFVA